MIGFPAKIGVQFLADKMEVPERFGLRNCVEPCGKNGFETRAQEPLAKIDLEGFRRKTLDMAQKAQLRIALPPAQVTRLLLLNTLSLLAEVVVVAKQQMTMQKVEVALVVY